MKVLIMLDKETGYDIDVTRSQLEDWEKEFPSQLRAADLSDDLVNRWLAHKAQGEVLYNELQQAFLAADNSRGSHDQ